MKACKAMYSRRHSRGAAGPRSTVGDGAMADAALELRDLLNRMLIEDLKSQETEAIARADADPARWRATGSYAYRRLQIEANLQTTNSSRYRSNRGRYLCCNCW